MDFVRFYADMLDDHFAELTDEEVGIIVRAALWYASTGEEPEFEKRTVLGLTWRRFKAHIDQSAAKAETLRANGSKPKQTKASGSKPKQTEAEESKTAHNHNQEQYQDHIQEQEQEQYNAREETPADDGQVLGIDGSDLSEHITRNQIADGLILRYRLSRDDVTREALLADLEQYGEQKMREVLDRACLSNSRERVTANFWRAILAGKGRDSPKDSGVGYGQILRQRNYDDDYFKSLEVNLDEAMN